MDRIDRLITPQLSRDLARLLYERGWTAARIARTIRASREFVGRVENATQSFSERDLKALARAAHTDVVRLLFDAMGPAAMNSELRELYESTRALVSAGEESEAMIARKATRRKRQSSTKVG